MSISRDWISTLLEGSMEVLYERINTSSEGFNVSSVGLCITSPEELVFLKIINSLLRDLVPPRARLFPIRGATLLSYGDWILVLIEGLVEVSPKMLNSLPMRLGIPPAKLHVIMSRRALTPKVN